MNKLIYLLPFLALLLISGCAQQLVNNQTGPQLTNNNQTNQSNETVFVPILPSKPIISTQPNRPTATPSSQSSLKPLPLPGQSTSGVVNDSNYFLREIDCDSIAKGVSFYQEGADLKDEDCTTSLSYLKHPGEYGVVDSSGNKLKGDFTRRDQCEHYCEWPTMKQMEDAKIWSWSGVKIVVGFNENGTFNPLFGKEDYNLGTGTENFIGKTFDQILQDMDGFEKAIGYGFLLQNKIIAESKVDIGDGGWYVHTQTNYFGGPTNDIPKYHVSLFLKKDNCFVTFGGDTDITYEEQLKYHPYNEKTKTYDNLHPQFDHGKEAVLIETLAVAREVDAAIGEKCKLKQNATV